MFEEIVDILDPEMNMVEEEDEIPEEPEDTASQEQLASGTLEPHTSYSVADSFKSESVLACV